MSEHAWTSRLAVAVGGFVLTSTTYMACDASPADSAPSSPDASLDVGARSTNDAAVDIAPPSLPEAGMPDAESPDAEPPVDTGPPAVRYVGRVSRLASGAVRFEWSGSAATVRFTGTSLGVKMFNQNGLAWFDVIVDGVVRPTPFHPDAATRSFTLVEGLAKGPHEVTLYRRSEADSGVTEIDGFTFDEDGAMLPPPPAPSRRIALVGDSVSCGFGDEGQAPCNFSYQTENHRLTFGALAARTLGADLVTTAWSGKGMYRDSGGTVDDGSDAYKKMAMPRLFQRALPLDATSVWSFDDFVPDALVIDLGTNDIAQGDPGQPYVDAYTSFLKLVRAKYPRAFILCAIGATLSGDKLATMRGHIHAAMTSFTSSGGANIGYLEFPPQSSAVDGLGCLGHPSTKTHEHMANQLVDALKTELHW